MSLCRICLRTDKSVIVINPTLSKFHDELSNFHTFDIIDSEFCSECEYLLKKMYNFKQKCKRAAKIYHEWTNGILPSETSMHDLYKFMPASTIGRWIPASSKVIIMVEGATLDLDNVTDGDLKQRSLKSYCKPKHLTENANAKEVINSTEECIKYTENKANERLSAVKTPRKVNAINTASNRKILKRHHEDDRVNAPSNLATKPNTRHNDTDYEYTVIKKELPLELPSNDEIDNVPNPQPMREIAGKEIPYGTTFKDHQRLQPQDAKLTLPSDTGPNKSMLVKSPCKVYVKNTESKKIKLEALDQDVTEEDPLELTFNVEIDNLPSPQPIITQPDIIQNRRVQSKSKVTVPVKPICKDSITAVPNKAMLVESPCKVYEINIESKIIKLETLDQDVSQSTISNTPHNDNEYEGITIKEEDTEVPFNVEINNVPIPQPMITQPDVTHNRPVQSDLATTHNDKSINENLMSVLRKYNISNIDFTKLKVAIPLKEVRKVNPVARKQAPSTQSKVINNAPDKKKRIRNTAPRKRVRKSVAKDKVMTKSKQDVMAEWYNLEVFRKPSMKRKSRYSEERLKALVKQQLESCGELKTEDGCVIDKQFIIDSLEEKVPEFIMRKLWGAVNGTSRVSTKALQLYRSIQNKYKHDYESMFDITYLNTIEKVLDEFENRKNYECYLNAEFKCEMCYQGFKYAKKLEYHQKWHQKNRGDFACTVCNMRYANKSLLVRHLVHSHEAVYKCKLCPLVTYLRNSMMNHYQTHKGVVYRCEPCNLSYGSRSAYETHASHKHSRVHVCNRCGSAFNTTTGLRWHTTRIHKDQDPSTAESEFKVKCLVCELLFPSRDVMEKHIRITHTAIAGVHGTPAAPGERKRKKKPKYQLEERKKPSFTCRVCNAVGLSGGWLSLHFRMEHPSTDMEVLYADTKTHLCDICGKGFSAWYILQTHLNKHNNLRPFQCDSCPKRFYSNMLLKDHTQIHLPPGRTCQYCGKKFRTEANLLNHKRVHVGDRRYKCKYCGKGFLHSHALKEHVRGVHHNLRRVRKKEVAEAEKN